MDVKTGFIGSGFRINVICLGFLLTSLLLCSCTWLPVTPTLTADQRQARLAQQALIDDKAGEDLQNELNLLNIIRAYEHRPRYYVDISSWTQAIPTMSVTATRDWHLNSAALGNSEALGLQSDTSTATVSPLTAQKFIVGITTPETPANVAYFASQGYPTSLLLHLFVRSISVYDKDGGLINVYTNDPMDAPNYAEFDSVANGLAGCSLVTADDDPDPSDAVGPIISAGDAANLRWQDDAGSKGYVLTPAPISTTASKAASPAGYFLVKAPSSHLAFKLGLSDRANMYCQSALIAMGLPELRMIPDKKPNKDVAYMKLSLRSPEAVFYYLGEITREQLDGPDNNSPRKALGIMTFNYSKSCDQSKTDAPCTPHCVDMFAITSSKSPPLPKDYYRKACGRPTLLDMQKTDSQHKHPALATDPDLSAENIAPKELAPDQGSLSVDYNDATYTMSWDYHRYDITLVAFTIAELIIGMQTDATELQKTPLVQAVQ